MHCYRQLYACATPPARFDDLPYKDKESRFFMNYYIPEDVLMNIINDTLKIFKIHKSDHKIFTRTILLGCAPTSIN